MSGKAELTEEQAFDIVAAVSTQNLLFLRERFKGVAMERHQWSALMSLAYNSRWKNGAPTLIGPNLTRFIKAGNWEEAANEIEFRSAGGVPPHLQKGIDHRRRLEAQLFRGVTE